MQSFKEKNLTQTKTLPDSGNSNTHDGDSKRIWRPTQAATAAWQAKATPRPHCWPTATSAKSLGRAEIGDGGDAEYDGVAGAGGHLRRAQKSTISSFHLRRAS